MRNARLFTDDVTPGRVLRIQDGGNAMQASINAVSHLSSEDLRFNLLLGVTYPLFLSVEIVNVCATALLGNDTQLKSRRSVFATARDNAAIAISYAFMARSTLQIFARRTRPERLS
jgi:hypothetical protein